MYRVRAVTRRRGLLVDQDRDVWMGPEPLCTAPPGLPRCASGSAFIARPIHSEALAQIGRLDAAFRFVGVAASHVTRYAASCRPWSAQGGLFGCGGGLCAYVTRSRLSAASRPRR